jgi:hypothetical protein
VGNVDLQLQKLRSNYVETQLVLGAHNEMTAQGNDGKPRSWVPEGEHALKMKGVRHGMHQSDVILSTIGWLIEASQSLEYGKSYDRYWMGELFVKQVRLILRLCDEMRLKSYRHRSSRKSFQHLNVLTDLVSNSFLWSTTLRATPHIPLMLSWPSI